MLDVTATVIWTTAEACGVRFRYIPDTQRSALQQWLTACVDAQYRGSAKESAKPAPDVVGLPA